MKIAIIGAGIFGCTSALKLREKFPSSKITIYEKSTSILSGASGINQFRLHRGYHYPRSTEMIQSTIEFESEFKSCIVKGERYYAIAKEGSLVTSEEYLNFLENNALKYWKIEGNNLPLHYTNLDLVVKVQESSFDPAQLYLELTKRLTDSFIILLKNTTFKKKDLKKFDLVINATYSNLNEILDDEDQLEYQFELCEKAVISVGKDWQNIGMVIMDGEFCCIDPLGFNKYFHVLGHVKEAIHDRQVGFKYKIPPGYSDILNIGSCKSSLSRFPFILNGCKEFFKFENKPVIPESSKGSNKLIGGVHYHGSMFTVRTVLKDRDHDDARPSYITKHSDSLYSIFSGKIGTSIAIANQLKEMI